MIPSDGPAILLFFLVLILAGAWFFGIALDLIGHALGVI